MKQECKLRQWSQTSKRLKWYEEDIYEFVSNDINEEALIYNKKNENEKVKNNTKEIEMEMDH